MPIWRRGVETIYFRWSSFRQKFRWYFFSQKDICLKMSHLHKKKCWRHPPPHEIEIEQCFFFSSKWKWLIQGEINHLHSRLMWIIKYIKPTESIRHVLNKIKDLFICVWAGPRVSSADAAKYYWLLDYAFIRLRFGSIAKSHTHVWTKEM